MGGGMSINQQNLQSVSNDSLQSSQENCTNVETLVSKTTIIATDSNINNLTDTNVISGNNSSCVLKSNLQTKLLNSLKDDQSATQFSVPGPFTVLQDLVGASLDENQNNAQIIANSSSQLMNSMCQNNNSVPSEITIIVNGSTLNNNNFSKLIKNNKSSCIISNSASFYAQNSATNTQVATQVQISMFVFIALIIVIGVIGVAAIKYGFKSKKVKRKDDDSAIKLIEAEERPVSYKGNNPPLTRRNLGNLKSRIVTR